MKFKGLVFCTDLDGTLYKSDKTISKENKEAIEYFKSEGGIFTFITGRMPCYSIDACERIEPNAPYGCINGGGLFDYATDSYVFAETINPKAKEFIDFVDARFPKVGITMQGLRNVYTCKESERLKIFRSTKNIPYIPRNCHEVDEDCGKLLFAVEEEEIMRSLIEALSAHPLAKDFTLIRSERTLFEILPKGVDKGLALNKLVSYLGANPEKTIAIGDYYNDIPMFREAKLGIAVKNACEEAKAAADYITVSNNEHAIAKVIRDIEDGILKI